MFQLKRKRQQLVNAVAMATYVVMGQKSTAGARLVTLGITVVLDPVDIMEVNIRGVTLEVHGVNVISKCLNPG